MRYFLFLLLMIAFACSPAQRIANICRKHPEACVTVRDSVLVRDTVVVAESRTDTVFRYDDPDTVYIRKDRLQIKYKYIPQTKEVYIEGKCETDTVYLEKKVACPPVKAPVIEKEDRWQDHWQTWVAPFITIAIAYLMYRLGKATA